MNHHIFKNFHFQFFTKYSAYGGIEAIPHSIAEHQLLTTPKYFLYIRKSTDEKDRQVLSLEAQFDECKEFAEREKLEIVEIFIEKKTAKVPGREIFNEMLGKIEVSLPYPVVFWRGLRTDCPEIPLMADGSFTCWILENWRD